jgi:hypothetical protein
MHKMSIESMILIHGLRQDPNIFITIFLIYFKMSLIFLKAKGVKELSCLMLTFLALFWTLDATRFGEKQKHAVSAFAEINIRQD